MKKYFRKPTSEEKVIAKAESVFLELTKNVDYRFSNTELSELELVQVMNMVRRKLSEHLEARKSDCFEQSLHYQQRAKEIENAISFIE